ncbi:NPP1 family protein [Pedobacter sp. GR22-6]|uniref:NPP1 family protein n=1 Tax=Pedobacter sp. GR22-6 TaxID=3127957 RepID=UPI00307E6C05
MKRKPIHFVIAMACLVFTQCTKENEMESGLTAEKVRKTADVQAHATMCADCQESWYKITGSEAYNLAWNFAPILKFDQAAPDYPTSIEDIWASTNPASIVCNGTLIMTNRNAPRSKNFPTYFEVQRHPNNSNRIFIDYWWTYKTQTTCFANLGGHDYDWEHVVVQVNTQTNRIVTVTYFQHSGWYTRNWQNVAAGTRPQVFVGKKAHGSYHNSNSISFPGYDCTYYGDYRNPSGSNDFVETWNTNLTEMTCQSSYFSFNGNFGTIGKGPLYRYRDYWYFSSCNGSAGITGTDGCSQSNYPSGTQLGGI